MWLVALRFGRPCRRHLQSGRGSLGGVKSRRCSHVCHRDGRRALGLSWQGHNGGDLLDLPHSVANLDKDTLLERKKLTRSLLACILHASQVFIVLSFSNGGQCLVLLLDAADFLLPFDLLRTQALREGLSLSLDILDAESTCQNVLEALKWTLALLHLLLLPWPWQA